MAVLEVIESCRKASDDGNKSVDIRLLPKSTEKSLTSKLNPVVTKNKQPLFLPVVVWQPLFGSQFV